MNEDSFFSNDWMETQRKYWESWIAMNRKAMGLEGGSQTAPWESALEHWWSAVSPAAPAASKQFMERMMEQGKSFFKMAETFLPTAGGGGDGWSAFSKALEDMQKGFMGGLGGSGDDKNAMHRMLAFWELPLDNWQRMTSSMSPMFPGDFLRNMPHDGMQDQVDRLLSAPGLGYTREEQGAYQDLIRRSIDYQKALQEYSAFYSKLGVKAVERMRAYMQDLISSGKTIDSARAIYDDWVNCCEAVYAEEVSTPAYAQLHGKLINSQMALKARMSEMVDGQLGALNMPTRTEIRTLQDRLQETRRENKKLSHGLKVLQAQVQALASGQPLAPGARVKTHNVPRAALIAGPADSKAAAPKKPAAKPTTK
ncbi:class III poly(R)-hydroxyalkanoic acid synthase subunit PhaE [uncultured Thiodictyon sp.]|uniref:class III poly(R)-hydroxyalkanoic acid synthase subunit PhaE n=1 Tax=uncultured Thiodictyon sp. TaxID=1846217 RepID=UPI0025DBBBF5|nr:class III poly(R)-hydroxyalkanoic acid synthase subunit PhaE [uncultured Thiodictyon sp.]